jgi:hypothetical protein
LSEKPDLGNLDLAAYLERRYNDAIDISLNRLLADREAASRTFFQRLCYSETAAFRRLEGRDGRITIHTLDELINFEIMGNTIFWQKRLRELIRQY